MGDINKVWISGVAVSEPMMTKLSGKTPLTSFCIQINEQFRDKNNRQKVKPNIVQVESLGKNAETTHQRVKKGARYTIDGYLRQDILDGKDFVRVRSFAIYPDETFDSITYEEGLKKAIEVVEESRDRNAALERLNELIG